MAVRGYFDTAAFFGALDRERQERGLLWKDVAKLAKISPSTLTRLAQGKRPDVDSLAALVDWAGLRADDFVVRVHSRPDAEPVALISTYLRADPQLDERAADAITKVVAATYDALAEKKTAEDST